MMFTKKIVSVGLLTILMAGCVPPVIFVPDFSDEDTETPEKVIFSGKVYIVGELDGTLAEEMGDTIEAEPYDGIRTDAPIAIPGDQVDNLDEQLIVGIRATYAAHWPILLIEATADQINRFHALLSEQPYHFSMPEGVNYAEVYAVDLEPDGTMFQWVQYPPAGTDLAPDTSF
ncbi:MAG: hypothetical protein GXY44_14285, partial [Phycisphaerales bacterium]|nr:hypothetical protein [Phycisphaerales bacterium]